MSIGNVSRLFLVATAVQTGEMSSQEDVRTYLKQRGINCTQGTVSKDLAALKVTTDRVDGRKVLVLEEPVISTAVRDAFKIPEVGVTRIVATNSVVVLHTPMEVSFSVAGHLDRNEPRLAGTIAGKDTVLGFAPGNGQDVAMDQGQFWSAYVDVPSKKKESAKFLASWLPSRKLTDRSSSKATETYACAVGSIVVVHTAPGSASAVAVLIDDLKSHSILGSVSGDDTVFVACRDKKAAALMAQSWEGVLSERLGIKTPNSKSISDLAMRDVNTVNAVFGDFLEGEDGVRSVADFVVARVTPGTAHVAGSLIDRLNLSGVHGTLAGDDVLVIATGGRDIARSVTSLIQGKHIAQSLEATG